MIEENWPPAYPTCKGPARHSGPLYRVITRKKLEKNVTFACAACITAMDAERGAQLEWPPARDEAARNGT